MAAVVHEICKYAEVKSYINRRRQIKKKSSCGPALQRNGNREDFFVRFQDIYKQKLVLKRGRAS